VRLDGVAVVIVESRPPLTGFGMECLPALRTAYQHLEVELRPAGSRARLKSPGKHVQRFPGGGLSISHGHLCTASHVRSHSEKAVESFAVETTAVACWCSWRLRFSYAVEGKHGTLIVDDHGEPFETTSLAHAETIFWDPQTGHWAPSPPRPSRPTG
jgi:hypothetical protein